MNRVVSIKQSEPGLYVITFQRSGAEPVGKILEAIANPPFDAGPNYSVPPQMAPAPAPKSRGGSRRKR